MSNTEKMPPVAPGAPLADPLDRISDALLSYVRGSMMGVIPHIALNYERAPSDLPGTTSENEWKITLTISAIEKLDETDGSPEYRFQQRFEASAPSKDAAISGIIEDIKTFLATEIAERDTQLVAAKMALRDIESMPSMDGMWATIDPSLGDDEVLGGPGALEDLDPEPPPSGRVYGR